MKPGELETRLDLLGITAQHCTSCQLPVQIETDELVEAEMDISDRPQRMTARTLTYWQAMKQAAANDGIVLQLVSAFRSVDYQCNLIQKKLASGQVIDDILKVNAIPGYSEHHTGRALDLTTLDCEPLEEDFENTDAFAWLVINAHRFHFHLSYPQNNDSSITYEPWHWACTES